MGTGIGEYVRDSMPRDPDEALEHSDRIRLDSDTALIQYRITLRGGEGLERLARGLGLQRTIIIGVHKELDEKKPSLPKFSQGFNGPVECPGNIGPSPQNRCLVICVKKK